MLLARGMLDDARTHLDRALVALGTAQSADRGVVHGARAMSTASSASSSAREHCKTAIDLLAAQYGPAHQSLAVFYNTWGTVELAARQHDAAREKWARAISIFEAGKLDHDRGLALALSNTAVSWAEQGDPERARPLYERSRDLFAKYNPDHVQRTPPLQGLASNALQRKDYPARSPRTKRRST